MIELSAQNTEDAGDKQLWIVTDEHWQAPVYATPRSVEGNQLNIVMHIEAAMSLSDMWNERIRSRLAPYRLGSGPYTTFIAPYHLELVASKAEGITPSYYLKEHTRSTPQTEPKVDEAFLAYVAKRTGFANEAQLLVTWNAITRMMLPWLLSGKPIDLGFAKIYLLPLRVDFPDRWFSYNLDLLERDGKRGEMKERLDQSLHDERLKGVHLRNCRLAWSLFIVPTTDTKNLFVASNAGRTTFAGYASHQYQRLEALKPQILAVLHSFGEQASIPLACIHRSGLPGGDMYVPDAPENTIPRGAYLCQKSRIPGHPLPKPSKSPIANLAEAHGNLLQMRTLQPETSDLRNGVPDLVQSPNPTT